MPDPSHHHPPPLTQSVLDEAKRNPNTRIYAIDAAYGPFAPTDPVPPHAIRGAWKTDSAGQIDGDFLPNPNYRPKPPTASPQPPRRLRLTDYLILAFILLVTLGFLTSLLLSLFSHPTSRP